MAAVGSTDESTIEVRFTVNGEPRVVEVAPDELLVDTLRDRLALVSVKRGCGQGQCGSCVILIDGRARTCCATPTVRVADRQLVTNEGLPEPARSVIARCYSAAGAVQCGFCTPGLVVRTAALLERDPQPSRPAIAKELRGHLCRCTGYVKILDAVELASGVLRGDRPLPQPPPSPRVGRRLPRVGAEQAARGEQGYVSDLVVPDMLYGALRLSDHPRARVVGIDTARAAALPGVVAVLTARDVPGQRRIGLIEQDWPCFVAEGEVTSMVGDVLAAVAAADERVARRAAALVQVDYEVLDPVVDPLRALAEGAPAVHPGRDNLLSSAGFARADAAAALAASAHVVEDRFRTQTVEHFYLEPEACLARPDADGGLTVQSQGQGIYDDRRQLSEVLGLAQALVRVHLVPTGGAFGGKEDLSVQAQTALLALCTGRPVRLALSREESIRLHPKRHPFVIDYELGCDEQGRLTAARVRMTSDTGAYASVGTKVVERAVGHALGPYYVPAADVQARCVYTNNPANGAMRGFGVGQVAFALEQLLDRLAEQVGLDAYQIRERNLLREGQPFGPGQKLRHAAGLLRTLEAVKESFDDAAIAGIACGIKNVGRGNGKTDVGRARIDVLDGGRLRLAHGMTEMGQGLNTVVLQLLAERAELSELADVQVEVCTEAELDCGMTTASRATVLVGNAVVHAAGQLAQDLAAVDGALQALAGQSYQGEFRCDWTTPIGAETSEPVLHLTYGFAAQVVTLDEHTGEIRKVVAAHDVGRAINPIAVEGQIEGAVHMGLGVALSEQLRIEGGRPDERVRKLGVLRAPEMPAVEVILVESPEPLGPYGARGVGEAGLVPTPAAVASALYRFDGQRRTSLPVAPATKR